MTIRADTVRTFRTRPPPLNASHTARPLRRHRAENILAHNVNMSMSTCQHVNMSTCQHMYTSYVVRLHVSALYFHVLLTFCFDASHHSFMHTCILVLTLQSCHRSIPTSLPSRTSWCVYVMRRVSSINTSIHYKRHLNFPCTWSDDQDEGNEAQ